MAAEQFLSGSVAGTPVVVNARTLRLPITVSLSPGGGNTSKCEVSVTKDAVENPGPARWVDWDPGTVAANAMTSIVSPITAIRFTRVTGAGSDTYDIVC